MDDNKLGTDLLALAASATAALAASSDEANMTIGHSVLELIGRVAHLVFDADRYEEIDAAQRDLQVAISNALSVPSEVELG